MNLILILKLFLVPALIAGVTLAGRRWGPAVAGWLSAFPVVSAPILFFIALDQGAGFAAVGTLSAVLAILAFGLSYAWAATRCGWGVSLLTGFVAYLAAVSGLSLWRPALWPAACAVLAALLLAPRLFPVAATAAAQASAKSKDIHWRMTAGAILVLLVTHFSSRLGPQLSGVFAMFPVMSSVLVVFSHRHAGAGFAINMLRGMVLGYYAFGVFCLSLSLALPALGLGAAFLVALAGALLVQAGSRVVMQRGQRQVLARV